MKKKSLRIVINITIGIIVSILLYTLLITIGYSRYSSGVYHIKAFNLLIYTINGNSGIPHPNNMLFIGILFSIIFVIIGEIYANWRIKKNAN
ncbi:LlsX family protein [Listeria aquatica]|uniref:LlsX family protein n=1 Tax=Listeria aquatica TaxID=1494960 RepID=UPI003F6FB107